MASDFCAHDTICHVLPDGDILIVDATVRDPQVAQAFSRAKEDLRVQARATYRRLQTSYGAGPNRSGR